MSKFVKKLIEICTSQKAEETTVLLNEFSEEKSAINKVLAVIEFTPDGIITEANDNFLKAVGYSKTEVVGQHHRIFVDTQYAKSAEYQAFWQRLGAGQFDQGQYKRIAKGGKELWLEASYNPIRDSAGKVYKIVKYATDITANKIHEFEFTGQLNALDKVLGVIEFTLTGKILAVNDNFVNATGYSREEIVGKHHSMFVDTATASSQEYRQFWDKLARGESDGGVYKRYGKDGNEIWLQATYNPILDDKGQPFKVVKFATDITRQKLKDADVQGQLDAIRKVMAVIEFDLKGNILTANDNFLSAVGYPKTEVIGQHHSMFVEPAYRQSAEYKAFWEGLARGQSASGKFKRIAQGGRELWLEASYNPIFDMNGKPFKVVKYATDITKEYFADMDNAGQIDSINRALGSIEFSMDGKITKVNKNFASLVGYDEREIVGKHHSMFVDAATRSSTEYRAFWEKLNRGEFDAGIYKRVGNNGKEIWLQASYNPILDAEGKPTKVVKFATDITVQKLAEVGLVKAVQETERIVEAAKEGDLTLRISVSDKSGAILNLCNGVNSLVDKMTEIVTLVRDAGQTINTTAGEISTGNNDLSHRTEKQASSLQETSSSMDQLASTVKQNAENAKQANQLALTASGVAIKGGEVVGNVVNTMSAINQSARKIEDIISVIDGIAFQTNILALNAAVEAARAGEQGRGFAVVAGEVRNLAQRSASAAKEIKDLIADSVSKTTEGTVLVEDAGKTMDEVVSSVQRVADIISEIAAASVQQTTGIDQVNHSITSMDEVTQQNAALVEEAAAAAESLVEQSVTLMETVSSFRLNETNPIQMKSSQKAPTSQIQSRKSAMVSRASASRSVQARTGTDDGQWEEF